MTLSSSWRHLIITQSSISNPIIETLMVCIQEEEITCNGALLLTSLDSEDVNATRRKPGKNKKTIYLLPRDLEYNLL
jgi:hypothetical protein